MKTKNIEDVVAKKVEKFAKELSKKVRWSSGYGQYENDSKEQQAYIDGVTTAIGMMYIDLTGTPKTEGMLTQLVKEVEAEKTQETMVVVMSKMRKLVDEPNEAIYLEEIEEALYELDKEITPPTSDVIEK